MIGIYKITSPSKKVYVGQSIDINRRFKDYKYLQCKEQPALYNSFMKHNVENHKFEVILECNIEDLNYYERCFQEIYNSIENGLNCFYVAYEGKNGKHSEKTKLKLKNRIVSKETREKLRILKLGTKQTKEHIEKSRLARMGYKHSQETKEKIINSKKSKIDPKSKMVIDLEVGFIYNSATECFLYNKDYIKVTYKVFCRKLQGLRKNNTKFNYI
jgi:group I intron endonuclease